MSMHTKYLSRAHATSDTAPAAPTASEPTTVPQLEATLEALELERAGYREALELLPERERGLLERDAPDADFQALEIQRKRIRHRVDKLDQREAVLLEALEQAQLAVRQADWDELVTTYISLAEAAVEQAAQLKGTMDRIRQLAGIAEGFVLRGHIPAGLPSIFGHVNWQEFNRPLQAAHAARSMRVTANTRPILATVRFTRFFDMAIGPTRGPAYPRGVEAGFPPATAWRLVEGGHAEWVDPTRIPPDPRPARSAAAQEQKR